jgi:Mn2+/Fe2+ NRAMP family transporter
LEKRDEWTSTGGVREAVKKSVLDLRVGFIMSAALAAIFLCVGATVLHPLGVDLDGLDLALKLSSVYTETVGSWAFPVFILVALMLVWGALYSFMDGVPRLAEVVLQKAAGGDGKRVGRRFRQAYTMILGVGALAFATAVPEPMFLVILYTSLGLLGYPVLYILNTYVVMKYVDKEHRPSKLNLALAFMGVAYAVVGFVLLLLVRVLGFWS